MMAIREMAHSGQGDGKRVALVGCGNIGSPLAGFVARMEEVSGVTVIDFDRYESKNLPGQDITAGNVGKPKVLAQRRRMSRIRPGLDVRAIHDRVENVPLGLLRSDVILAALDSRPARQQVNQAAWRLGVPWIDAGVDASGLLVRVMVYVPGGDSACLECAWDRADYAAIEQSYPCHGQGGGPAATNAPAALGAVAAGLMALECRKLLAGDDPHLLVGRQVMLDLRHHTQSVTTYRPNAQCLFDHQTWQIEPLAVPPAKLALGRALRLAGGDAGTVDCALRLEGHSFARQQFCPACGHHQWGPLCMADRIARRRRRCGRCGREMTVRGFDMIEWISGETLKPDDRRRSLYGLGFRRRDVFSVRGPAGCRHFELGAPPPATEPRRAGQGYGRSGLESCLATGPQSGEMP